MANVAGSQVVLSLIKESTYGTTPTVNTGDMTALALVTKDINGENSEINSRTVTPDGFAPIGTTGFESVTGSLEFELSAGTLDFNIPLVANSDWTTDDASEASVGVDFAASGSTATRSVGDWTTTFDVGDAVIISGAAEAENNGLRVITALTATVMTLTDKMEDGEAVAIVDEITATISVQGHSKYIDHVQTNYSYSAQRKVGDDYYTYTGVVSGGWGLSVTPDNTVSMTTDLLGKAEAGPTGTPLDSAPTEQSGSNPFSPVDAAIFIHTGGIAMECATDLSVTLNANISTAPVIASTVSCGVQRGTISFDGSTVTVFYDDVTSFPSSDTTFAMSIVFREAGTERFLSLYFPEAKILNRTLTVPSTENVTQQLSLTIGKAAGSPLVRYGYNENAS